MYLFRKSDHFSSSVLSAELRPKIKSTPPHMHDYFEIEYIISGSGIYCIDGVDFPIASGMAFFTTPANFHSVSADGAVNLINVSFSTELCDQSSVPGLLETGAPVAVEFSEEDAIFFKSLLTQMVRFKSNISYQANLLSVALNKMALSFSSGEPQYSSYIRSALIYILGNFRSDITLSSAAEHVGLTPSYFSSYFSEHTGMNFKTYLNSIRFDYAAKLLRATELSVAQICIDSGFHDYANFSRRFKEKFGISPAQWRQGK